MKAAEPILADIDGFLSSGELDQKLVKAAVLADGKPRDLAVFAQQGGSRDEGLVHSGRYCR